MSSKAHSNGEAPGVTEHQASLLPHLESLDRMLKLPVVDATWQQTQSVYGRVKDSNNLLNWAFGTAEDVVHRAVSISAPLVQKLDRPLQLVDQTLVKGIDKLEENAPIIKEQPQEIYNQAKTRVLETVKPYTEKVCELRSASHQKASSLKDLSWKKANEVLATQYGSIAVTGVDTTAQLAERLLDYFFPKSATDVEENEAPISASDDPVLHTVQTVGRLSNKVARRVYRTVSHQVKSLRKEDVKDYIATLIAVLRLTQYLNFLNDKVPQTDKALTEQAESSSGSNEGQKQNGLSPVGDKQPKQSTPADSNSSATTVSDVVATTNSAKTLKEEQRRSDTDPKPSSDGC
ncbi:lipid storage droplets surface-binding protein 2-like [Toxorhynchites rutilus septentrionalis]|uniref:lipid storage droplets surface-binding protein 2-like n=1 Tax=Toxorhynchites rutilus septentrionalis TaxID=329112 RepID=UPI00247AADC0|nr:lipid storage droplets surface-binding protein 2-like [Toxorhynchites rutilus septentrionalis]